MGFHLEFRRGTGFEGGGGVGEVVFFSEGAVQPILKFFPPPFFFWCFLGGRWWC